MRVVNELGILKKFLAKKRAKIVDQNISPNLRYGKILDIGCGNFPYFLSSINFKEKIGLDKDFKKNRPIGVELIKYEIEKGEALPFPDESFNVITILDILRHMDADLACEILVEIRRVLKKNGQLFITVSRGFINKKKLLDKICLFSNIGIDRHAQLCNRENIIKQLRAAGFNESDVTVKYFKFGLKIFIKVEKITPHIAIDEVN